MFESSKVNALSSNRSIATDQEANPRSCSTCDRSSLQLGSDRCLRCKTDYPSIPVGHSCLRFPLRTHGDRAHSDLSDDKSAEFRLWLLRDNRNLHILLTSSRQSHQSLPFCSSCLRTRRGRFGRYVSRGSSSAGEEGLIVGCTNDFYSRNRHRLHRNIRDLLRLPLVALQNHRRQVFHCPQRNSWNRLHSAGPTWSALRRSHLSRRDNSGIILASNKDAIWNSDESIGRESKLGSHSWHRR